MTCRRTDARRRRSIYITYQPDTPSALHAMAQYILRRLALLVPVLLGVSLVVFTLVRLIPGTPRCWRSGSTSGSPPSNASRAQVVRARSAAAGAVRPLDAARAPGRPRHLAAHPPLGQ